MFAEAQKETSQQIIPVWGPRALGSQGNPPEPRGSYEAGRAMKQENVHGIYYSVYLSYAKGDIWAVQRL